MSFDTQQKRLRRIVVIVGSLLLGVSLPAQSRTTATSRDYTKNVDPFIGVDWGGNTFVGAAVPFGMVKLGPDMENFDGKPSGFGYISGGRILGFSHLHLSGASGKYGNILVAPVTGPLSLSDIQSPRTEEVARVGYYAAQLTRYKTRVELTSTRRVGFHRYTFPASKESHLTLNLAHCLNKGTGSESQRFLGAQLHLISDHEAEGVGRYTGGWNKGGEYKVYFYMVLDTPAASTQTWVGDTLSVSRDAAVTSDQPIGATFNFSTKAGQVVQAKVAISFVSTDQARRTVQEEAPGWSFDEVHAASGIAHSRRLIFTVKPIRSAGSSTPRCTTPC
jgi:putative alpha-1,2-mannosidase